MTRSFDVFFDLRLNKQLSKQSWGDLRRHRAHYDVTVLCAGQEFVHHRLTSNQWRAISWWLLENATKFAWLYIWFMIDTADMLMFMFCTLAMRRPSKLSTIPILGDILFRWLICGGFGVSCEFMSLCTIAVLVLWFSLKTKVSQNWQLCRYWLHRKLSLRRYHPWCQNYQIYNICFQCCSIKSPLLGHLFGEWATHILLQTSDGTLLF